MAGHLERLLGCTRSLFFHNRFGGVVGYHACLTFSTDAGHKRSPDRARAESLFLHFFAPLGECLAFMSLFIIVSLYLFLGRICFGLS